VLAGGTGAPVGEIIENHYRNHYRTQARNAVNSNESKTCWSGGTGRRTGLKSQPLGALTGKPLRVREFPTAGNPR
jgi:hypothetical protein